MPAVVSPRMRYVLHNLCIHQKFIATLLLSRALLPAALTSRRR
jgi:hypothetical protein